MSERWKTLTSKELVEKHALAAAKWAVEPVGECAYSYADIKSMEAEMLRRMGDDAALKPHEVIHRAGELVAQVIPQLGGDDLSTTYLREADSALKNAWECME